MLSVLTGPGGVLGDALVSDPRVRKVSFTGSTGVGEHITRTAGVKKLSLELGASCPVVILPDADIEAAADAVALGGYINAGQVCISVQRVIIAPVACTATSWTPSCPRSRPLRFGDPSSTDTRLGTLITEARGPAGRAAISVARSTTVLGCSPVASVEGALVTPAVVDDVAPEAPLNQDELFGPAVAVSTAEDWTSAIAQANSTAYGLGAGVFTSDIAGAVRAMRQIDAGVIHFNWTPLWRADLMPYGGLKASGIGKEGFRSRRRGDDRGEDHHPARRPW